jgi:hypothetical protein
MVPKNNAKYHRLDITMKTGFKYSVCCNGKMLNGMKESSGGFWTEKIDVSEITLEEYEKFYNEPEEILEKKSKKPKKPVVFSTVEDFLEGNTKPKKKKL